MLQVIFVLQPRVFGVSGRGRTHIIFIVFDSNFDSIFPRQMMKPLAKWNKKRTKNGTKKVYCELPY